MDNQTNENMEQQIQNDASFNLKNIKDVTLSNGKRIIVMFKNDSSYPTVIEYNGKSNILDDVRERQQNDPKYQSTDARYNAEQILDDIAKEQKGYALPKVLDEKYEVSEIYMNDLVKLKKLSVLITQARQKNLTLPNDEQYAYIDEENDYIMTKTGKVLEAIYDPVKDMVAVQSPGGAAEFKDSELDAEKTEEEKEMNQEAVEEEEQGLKDEEIDAVYDQIFIQGGSNLDKQEVKDNLKKIAEDPDNINNIPEKDREWYKEASKLIEEKKLEKEYSKTMTYKSKSLIGSQTGSSNGLLIAIIVLFIVFAVFMYIIFRR